ncbi:serine protease inhibitor Kazal-type 13 isoform X2 [Sus scrofa]|nr:serine protease inhibitor Kazal-type 13 isoform X2 [Sus scrofa]
MAASPWMTALLLVSFALAQPVCSGIFKRRDYSRWPEKRQAGNGGGGPPGVIHVAFYGVCSPPVKCTTRGVLGVTQSVLMSQHMCVPPTARLTRMSVSFVLITGNLVLTFSFINMENVSSGSRVLSLLTLPTT